MNLTAAIAKALTELRQQCSFNGLRVLEVRYATEEQKRKDAEDDGLSRERIESYINDYACCGVHFDVYEMFEPIGEYVKA